MPELNINRQYKDSLFRLVFGEYKDHALSLYNAVNHTDYTDVENLEIKVLKDALYIDVKNDVGYVFHDIINLIEHQSTYNPNMPLRGLGYFSDMYMEYISEVFKDSVDIYSEKQLRIPTPKYFVLYNGTQKIRDDVDLRLSDAYEGEGDLEVVAHMLNINKGHSRALLDACKPLRDYSELIDRIRRYKSEGGHNEDAVLFAIDSCIKDGVLEEILRKERDKVSNILIRGLTEEEKERLQRKRIEYGIEQGIAQGIEQGIEQGIAQGIEQGIAQGIEQGVEQGFQQGRDEAHLEDVDKLVTSGAMDAERACEILGVSYEKYQEHVEQNACK